MPTITKYGACEYLTYTQSELLELGLVVNPNMWVGDGWRFCTTCQNYGYVYAMSHRGKSDCYEVCKLCHTHSRRVIEPILRDEYNSYLASPTDPRD